MVNNFTNINKTNNHQVIVCLVDIGEIVDHLCLEVVICFVDIGGIVDHHCLEVTITSKQRWSTILPISTKRTITSK
jgi:hypothetical protein